MHSGARARTPHSHSDDWQQCVFFMTSNDRTKHTHNDKTSTVYTRIEADNFWLHFDDKVLGVGLYVGHATQPYFNSPSQHGMDH